MDNEALRQLIVKIPVLKFKYLGSFAADQVPWPLPKNKFIIVNTEPSSETGQHWVLLANKDGKIYYGDSLGQPLHDYKAIKLDYDTTIRLVPEKVQHSQGLCGLYCIFIACRLYQGLHLDFFLNDFYILQFVNNLS